MGGGSGSTGFAERCCPRFRSTNFHQRWGGLVLIRPNSHSGGRRKEAPGQVSSSGSVALYSPPLSLTGPSCLSNNETPLAHLSSHDVSKRRIRRGVDAVPPAYSPAQLLSRTSPDSGRERAVLRRAGRSGGVPGGRRARRVRLLHLVRVVLELRHQFNDVRGAHRAGVRHLQ